MRPTSHSFTRSALAKFAELPRFAALDRAAILHAAFPDLRVVNVTRRDRARQAVSWARMAQDGVWVLPADEPAPAWRQLYDELRLTPCEVVYEDLASSTGYEPTMRRVLAHLGLPAVAQAISPPRTRRQSNELNDQWLARYLAERDAVAPRPASGGAIP